MLHVDHIIGKSEREPLASDIQELIRVVGIWAVDRPILHDVSLFGQRLRQNHNGAHPVEFAARFDDARLNEGFDDWIEQLRTGFANLSEALREPVCVLTPDMRPAWHAIVYGTELRALAAVKVRIMTERMPKTTDQDQAPPRPFIPVSQRASRRFGALLLAQRPLAARRYD